MHTIFTLVSKAYNENIASKSLTSKMQTQMDFKFKVFQSWLFDWIVVNYKTPPVALGVPTRGGSLVLKIDSFNL